MSRTKWRGIRGHLGGSAYKYALKGFLYSLLDIITLGLTSPYTSIALYKIIINNSSFGSIKATFNGKIHKLLVTKIISLVLLIPTLGISALWYRAKLLRYLDSQTCIGSIQLKSTHTTLSLFKFYFGNILIILCTLGLGSPIVIQRTIKYLTTHLMFIGDIDALQIFQSNNNSPSDGEGLSDVFGVDYGMI